MQLDDELRRLGDAELVARVRAREDAPYAELYRRHRHAATALARTLIDRAAADDVVADAFEKLFLRIRSGGGPQTAFRPYLLQTVRTVAVDSSRRARRVVVADDPDQPDETVGTPGDSLFDTVYERTTLARAFGALPDRWQTFLWLSCVEGADRQEIATILGIRVGGVSQLGIRAREGLRRAFLDAHLVGAPTTTCSDVWPLLSGSVRGGLTAPQNKKVDGHVSECAYCRDALAELDSVNAGLGVLLAPIVLGAAAPAYLGAVGHAHGAAATSGALGAGAAETGGTAAKAGILGLVKGGAASMAVVASTSTVAVVAMLAILTAPPGSLPSAAPGPDRVTSDVAQRLGSQPTDGSSAPTASHGSATPALASSAGAPTAGASATAGSPTTSTDPTGGPTGGPTGLPSSGAPTPNPTHNPSTPATASATPTDGPTGGPTSHPPTGAGDPTPTADGTPTAASTPGGDPTPTVQARTQDVSAQLGSVSVTPRPDTPGLFMHVGIPVTVSGGPVNLQVLLTISGLTNYETDTTTGYGAWTCDATTPMAGNAKVARLLCELSGVTSADSLDLGMNLNYVGDPNTLTADLSVLAPSVDNTSGDDTASAALPPKKDVH